MRQAWDNVQNPFVFTVNLSARGETLGAARLRCGLGTGL